jgi:hypothetical protein
MDEILQVKIVRNKYLLFFKLPYTVITDAITKADGCGHHPSTV